MSLVLKIFQIIGIIYVLLLALLVITLLLAVIVDKIRFKDYYKKIKAKEKEDNETV